MGRVKKVKSKGQKTAKKSRTAAKSVDEYLAGVPEPGRGTLHKIRAAIRSVVPQKTTEIISYGIPAFKHDGVLIWYAAFADHCSLFPTAAVIETFKNALKSYTISKGTIQFPLDKPLPAALVKEMVRMRIAQTKSKKRG
jgi:uncharacterized protein YdhG (YjbR/CyaY superfamily)